MLQLDGFHFLVSEKFICMVMLVVYSFSMTQHLDDTEILVAECESINVY